MRSVAWLGCLALAACYTPYQPACGFVCGTSGECPPDYTCQSDNLCHLQGHETDVCAEKPVEFDVSSAMAVSSVAVAITFSGVPNAMQAQDASNYTIPGLTLSGQSMLSGSTIRLATTAQTATTYTVTVANVTRETDSEPLTIASATFTGRKPFGVASAAAVNNHTITVTFDAAPESSGAMTLSNYQIVGGIGVSGTPTLAGNTVTLTTDPQLAQAYTVVVSNVQRASDFEPLTTDNAGFTGRAAFDVMAAASTGVTSLTVTFDAPPDATLAMDVTNYTVAGLTLSSPSLSGNTVTLTSDAQSGATYTMNVANVTRAADGEPLTTASAMFAGTDHCTDNIQDGDETDTDCGGPTCVARCAQGKMCLMNSDCQSNNCATNVCGP